MTIFVIGLGSMGKRRIRLLQQLDSSINIIGVDGREDRCQETKSLYDVAVCKSLLDVSLADCKIAFICTAPLSHAKLITWCLNHNLNVFTEINLVADRYQENVQLAKEKNLTLFLSSTFLYRDEITYIREEVAHAKSLLTYSYHVGQYLPDWHPWENYEDYFIGDIRTNACRELMAIEFPWLSQTFGTIVEFSVIKNKKTDLKTSYCDSYLLLFLHESGIQGSVMIDVVSRKAVRNLEIWGEDLYISWDGTPTGLRKYDINDKTERDINLYKEADQQEKYAAFVVENAYKNEIITFLASINDGKKPKYGFEDDLKILELIDNIEEC